MPNQTRGERGQVELIDRPDLAETFVDTIDSVIFDGQTLRITWGVTRRGSEGATARRYPACRLVMPPATAAALINQMQQVTGALIKAGVLKQG